MKTTSILLIALTLYISCAGTKTKSEVKENQAAWSTLKIANNLYCDMQEVSFLSWQLFSGHTEFHYGKNSREHELTKISPIKGGNDCLLPLIANPLISNEHPVVGVTQLQAHAYAKWRTNMCFLSYLIQQKKVRADSMGIFTVEKYKNGTYPYIIPGEKAKYFPLFRLPTLAERKLILTYADSINRIKYSKGKLKKCKNLPYFISDSNPCDEKETIYLPTSNLITYKFKINELYHVRGNVAEWTAQPGVSAGGGWGDKRQDVLDNDFKMNAEPNLWTGIRCVMEWVPLEKD